MVITLILVLILGMDAYVFASIVAAIKRAPYKKYLSRNFPDLKGNNFLMAHRFMDRRDSDICIAIDDLNRRFILLFPNPDRQIEHKIYPFESLKDVISQDNVQYSGKLIQVFKYQNALILTFNNNIAYRFLLSATGRDFKKDRTARHLKTLHGDWKQKLLRLVHLKERKPRLKGKKNR